MIMVSLLVGGLTSACSEWKEVFLQEDAGNQCYIDLYQARRGCCVNGRFAILPITGHWIVKMILILPFEVEKPHGVALRLYNVGTGYKPITVLADTCAVCCFAPDKRLFPVFDMEINVIWLILKSYFITQCHFTWLVRGFLYLREISQ